jgi:hypothetical protein
VHRIQVIAEKKSGFRPGTKTFSLPPQKRASTGWSSQRKAENLQSLGKVDVFACRAHSSLDFYAERLYHREMASRSKRILMQMGSDWEECPEQPKKPINGRTRHLYKDSIHSLT